MVITLTYQSVIFLHYMNVRTNKSNKYIEKRGDGGACCSKVCPFVQRVRGLSVNLSCTGGDKLGDQ